MVWFHATYPRGPPIALFVRSSHHEQITSLFALSSSFFLLKQETTAFAPLLGGLYPRACGPAGSGNPHPLRSMLIDVCLGKHQWRRSVPGFPLPIARSHTIVICKGNHIKPPATRSPTQKYQSIVTQKIQQKYHILENVPVPPCYQIAPSYRKLCSYPQVLYYSAD